MGAQGQLAGTAAGAAAGRRVHPRQRGGRRQLLRGRLWLWHAHLAVAARTSVPAAAVVAAAMRATPAAADVAPRTRRY